ncbi:MAG: LPS assembly protein LptD, partial [Proteobacteria bacterium]|nr:LPS assembly protein LptD [Pseudomonadota bacterium]
NEDSQSFDLDTTNLFSIDRFAGYDRWESGTRVAYGMKFSHYTDGGVKAFLLVGQSYRFRRDPTLPADSGLQSKTSDLVLTATLSVPKAFDYYHRLRFDKDSFKVVRNEGLVAFGPENLRFFVGYTDVKRNGYDPTLPDRREIRTATRFKLSQYWSMSADFSYDFQRGDGALTAGGGFTYEDECLLFRIRARRDFTEDRDVRPSTSVGFQLVFKFVSDSNTSASRGENNQYNPALDGTSGHLNRTGYGL